MTLDLFLNAFNQEGGAGGSGAAAQLRALAVVGEPDDVPPRVGDLHRPAGGHGEGLVEPVAGANLILSIDSDLQRLAEKAVSHVAAAAVVIVEAKTGRVRAMVSKPSFDPNVMTGHLTHAEYTLLMQDPRKPFIDKTVRATYPPGSIFKFVTALAALEDGQAA